MSGTVTTPQGPGHLGIVQEVRDWIDEPFVGTMDITTLFLLVGLVIVMIGLWMMILYHIRIAATEVI